MKVLGIDPGIERFGWALVEKTPAGLCYLASGVERTSPRDPHGERLLALLRFLEGYLKEAKPELVAMERVFFEKNAKTAIAVGEIRGVVLAVSAKFGLPLVEFSPPEVKLLVSGYGKADKRSVAEMVRRELKLDRAKRLDDETDALALALCGIFRNNYSRATGTSPFPRGGNAEKP